MTIVVERRACAILRNLALSCDDADGVFLLPANVCPVVPLVMMTTGRAFELIDIDPDDLCMDRRLVRARLDSDGRRVTGILWVRTYGREADESGAFTDWKRSHPHCLVIDDRCACRPEPDEVDRQGADVVLFSTGYGKYVDMGFGGFAHLAPGLAYERVDAPFAEEHALGIAALYKRHIARDTALTEGAPSPADDETGRAPSGGWRRFPYWIPTAPDVPTDAYLRSVRARLPEITEHKARMNDVYRSSIPAPVQLEPEYCHWRFQTRVPGKADLLRHIRDAGHIASDHYYPASRLFGTSPCPRAERLHGDILNLFNDHYSTPPQAAAVARIVSRHLRALDTETARAT